MAIIKKYISQVTDVKNPLKDIFVVSFRALHKNYKFKPGHFLHLALDKYDPSLPWPDSRCFSIQSDPDESDIKITYSVKGKFTSRMAAELKPGKEVCLKLPFGDLFTSAHNKESCVFIAGGTGVTPYLSLFTSVLFKEYKNPRLYLGVRDKSYNIYSEYLERSKALNSNFDIHIVSEKTCGILNIEKILNESLNGSTYFISGPPQMIKSFKSYLIQNKVSPDRVRTDDWE